MPVPQKKAETTLSAKDRVYRTVQQWIIDGTLEPGERLNDMELAEYFSVSRTPVREALQLLGEQRLVQVLPSRGTYVTDIGKEDLFYVYEMLSGLHALALELCIGKLSESALHELEELNMEFLRCAGHGIVASVEADYAFHNKICELSGNPYLRSYSDQLSLQARRNENRFFQNYQHLEESFECHRRIIEALRAGDLDTAKKEMRINWQGSLETVGNGR